MEEKNMNSGMVGRFGVRVDQSAVRSVGESGIVGRLSHSATGDNGEGDRIQEIQEIQETGDGRQVRMARINVRQFGHMSQLYGIVREKLPHPVALSFAYGSAVKQQQQQQQQQQYRSKDMIDLVLVVDSPAEWHQRNLLANPGDYSWAGRTIGPSRLQHSAAGLYYNTLVPLEDTNPQLLLKYGVMGTRALLDDLENWTQLYAAGRLHKPVEFLQPPTDGDGGGRLAAALRYNLGSAVAAALLLLPADFSRRQLYHALCRLSYSGDFRMIFGENKRKVENIVGPQMRAFGELYGDALASFSDVLHLGDALQQDKGVPARLRLLRRLPAHPRRALCRDVSGRGEPEDDALELAARGETDLFLRRSLAAVVWNSSVRQSIKGVLTAGPLKSLIYSARKIRKMF